MSDQLTIEGKDYVSSKRASELSGYTQDYIGQLARSSQIEAQRIGGLWYISMPSLSGYKEKADQYKPEPPKATLQQHTDSLVSFDGKDYVSANRAADITGYHQDYVGQLARSGKVLSRQIGNRWYVEREGIQAHKEEKDALLAAVQAESVGLRASLDAPEEPVQETDTQEEHLLTYVKEDGDLMPVIQGQTVNELETSDPDEEHQIPIRVTRTATSIPQNARQFSLKKSAKKTLGVSGKTIFYGTLAASALTIVVVLSFGFGSSIKTSSVYTVNISRGVHGITKNSFTASVASAFDRVADLLEQALVPELNFKRIDQ